ncbi:ImmA/IrrE family metallo-endopeptidase [Oceanimonas sp. AH20CE76]|uniref:ImmA/IrrE family metallo-endopeptidase n=1 Tax=Oceanimonas sp. AH20CE76 TaxID=2977120 RepID=UPI0031FEA25E
MEEALAKRILDAHWDKLLPVRPADIARALGMQIDVLDGPELSGEAEIRDGHQVIKFNRNESTNRQRFTMAHEIGHHVLGHVTPFNPKHRDNAGSFSSGNHDWQEVQANRFAAALLMPKLAIETLVYREGITNISRLAEIMRVSEAAMYYRLKNLNML